MPKVFIVAEMSGNHNGDYNEAVRLIRAAARCGADAIKLQTYTPDMLTVNIDNEWTRIKGGNWDGKTLYQLYQEACTPLAWHASLKTFAEDCGLEFFSTPFSPDAVAFLNGLGVKRFKVASYEVADYELLEAINALGKPVIVSVGMASLEEIERVLVALARCEVTLLKCTAAYPAMPEDMNLDTLRVLRWYAKVGLSDHSLSTIIPAVAVGMGATVIEKHLILSRLAGGVDSEFSLEPAEFAEMVKNVREAERSIGSATFGPTEREKPNVIFRRSVFAVAPIQAGELFTRENVRVIRPGYGLHPGKYKALLGKVAGRAYALGEPIDGGERADDANERYVREWYGVI